MSEQQPRLQVGHAPVRVASAYFKPGRKLVEDTVVRYESRLWRVGLVNTSRARLDPLTANVTMASPVSGRSFRSYGPSVSISPTAASPVTVELEDLSDEELLKYVRLQEQAELEVRDKRDMEKIKALGLVGNKASQSHNYDGADDDGGSQPAEEEENDMAVAGVAGVKPANAVPNVAAAPVAAQSKAALNQARLERLAKIKAADKAQREGKTAANVAAGKTRAKKADRECACGCGGATGGYFIPGHDARFKGWLLKIERGQAKREELMSPEVVAAYKWVKSSWTGGYKPTKNYKGEDHAGYAGDPPAAE